MRTNKTKKTVWMMPIAIVLVMLFMAVPVEAKAKKRLTPRSKTLSVGQEYKLKLKGLSKKDKKSKKRVSWKISDKSVVVFKGKTKYGVTVKARKTGTVKVTGTYKGKKYCCKIKVVGNDDSSEEKAREKDQSQSGNVKLNANEIDLYYLDDEDRQYITQPSGHSNSFQFKVFGVPKDENIRWSIEISYDMLSFSSHKTYGPQGIGALVLRRKNYKLPPVKPIMFGGQQEHGISPGTIPVALVGGFGKACELAAEEYKKDEVNNMAIKDMLIEMLKKSGIKYKINGSVEHCISSTLNIQIEGVSSEALMLTSKEYCSISNGSACTSSSYSPSYVLVAMGMSEDEIDQSIRLSWGRNIDYNELKSRFFRFLGVAKGLA